MRVKKSLLENTVDSIKVLSHIFACTPAPMNLFLFQIYRNVTIPCYEEFPYKYLHFSGKKFNGSHANISSEKLPAIFYISVSILSSRTGHGEACYFGP
jgi:hypothetical protein